MAALFFNTHQKELSQALANVGELKSSIAEALRKTGFTDVVHTQTEVAGNRSGVRVSIQHLLIGGRNFWEVVVAAGDALNATQATINEVVQTIAKLKFF